MHIVKVWSIASLSAAALFMPLLVVAQQPPSDAPPKLEMLEEGEPPAIKLGKPEDEHKVTETRDDSGVKEIKVQTGVSTYYLKPNKQVGNALPGDAQSTTNRGAEWKILEFGRPKPKDASEQDGAAPPDLPK
ncbi:MAG: DUF2782 domain-containing protein [Burkholderiales bacterium]